MQWFKDIRLSSKLMFGFGLVIILMGVIVLSAYVGINTMKQSQQIIYSRVVPLLSNLMELNTQLNAQRADALNLLLEKQGKGQQQQLEVIQQRSKQIDGLFQKLFELSQYNESIKDELRELESIRVEMAKTRDDTIQLVLSGKTQEAFALSIGVQDKRMEKVRIINQKLIDEAQNGIRTSVNQSEIATTKATITFIIIGVLSVFIVIVLVITLNHVIAKPLDDLKESAEKISEGDLDITLPSIDRKDEVGILSGSFLRMVNVLKSFSDVAKKISSGDLTVKVKPLSNKDTLGNAFKLMIEGLQFLSAEILEAVNILTSSVSQISTSTTQLAVSSTETATAVSETTSTIEEVRQTSQVSSQKAKSVSDNAQNAAQISQSGKKSTQETNEGMMRIRDQMVSIAESMMRLSEQTQGISSIIETVDDLAQQSNLLAVNASIEAEKAGDQGKGFRIVAHEIKSLADQSKQATHRVREILSDVQKATNTAVLATEQGNKAAESGVKKSEESGESIIKLSASITDAAQAALQIAASGQQQLIGIEQAATAMENIKQASTQNVDSARQLEVAAHNLKELGMKLKQLVGKYKTK